MRQLIRIPPIHSKTKQKNLQLPYPEHKTQSQCHTDRASREILAQLGLWQEVIEKMRQLIRIPLQPHFYPNLLIWKNSQK
jgi:hypothetical protein